MHDIGGIGPSFVKRSLPSPKSNSNLRKMSALWAKLKITPLRNLLWVYSFWGRYNMGAIEFSIDSLIFVDFGNINRSLHPK